MLFEFDKGRKRLIFSCKPSKRIEGLEIQSLRINIKKFSIQNCLKIGNFHLALMADEGHRGQHLVLAT